MSRYIPVLLCLLIYLPATCFAAPGFEPLFLDISLNQSPKGSLFVLASEGDYWLADSDLMTLGLDYGDSPTASFEGIDYYSLRGIENLQFEFEPTTVSLSLTIDPGVLPRQSLDVSNRQRHNVIQPRDDSFFLNYSLGHTFITNPDVQETSIANEIGGRGGDWLFLSDSLYRSGDQESSFRRLMTRAIHDNREDLVRTTIGDQYFSTGPLGGQGLIGGAGYTKLYTMQPNIKKYPGILYSGIAETPSEIEIFLDGSRIHREKVEPGTFEISHLNRFGGAGNLEVVVRDSYGLERREYIPFYVEEQLLRDGQHEYSYVAGLLREKFGTDDDAYEDGVLSASHDYGYNRNWTLGYRAEIGDSIYNLASRALWNSRTAGSFELTLAGSTGDDSNGSAQAFAHHYRARFFSTSFTLRNFSENYTHLATRPGDDRLKTSAEFSVGFFNRTLGSINFRALFQTKNSGQEESILTLALNRQIARDWRLSSNINYKDQGTGSTTDFYFGLTYSPMHDHQISLIAEKRGATDSQTLMWQKNAPSGEGYGYRMEVASEQRSHETLTTVNPAGQYNARYAALRGNYEWEGGGANNRQTSSASISGALAFLGGKLHVTRPIRDSFALVKIGDVADVKVYSNSQLEGRTSQDGSILIPSLNSFYNNRISLDDQDIPIDYTLPEIEKFVAPPFRSGSCFVFATRKYQPITGKLLLNTNQGQIALENLRIELIRSGEDIILETGKDGEFYFEPGSPLETGLKTGCDAIVSRTEEAIAPSTYQGTITFQGEPYHFDLNIPRSNELFIDLGTVIVEASP